MRRPLTNAEQARVARFTPFARELALAMAHDWPRRFAPELVSSALLRLTEIASDFDPRVQEDFWGFAYHHIRGAVLNQALSLTKATAREKALYGIAMREGHAIFGEPVPINIESETPDDSHVRAKRAVLERAAGLLWSLIMEREASQSDQLEQREEYSRAITCLRRATTTLEPRSRVVLESIYRDGLTHETVGARLIPPISSKQVQRIHRAARQALARALETEGIIRAPEIPDDADFDERPAS